MMSFKSYFFQASIVQMLLFMIMTPSLARLNVQVSSGEINGICSKTLNPSYCVKLLKSTPGTATADLKSLAKIILDLARSNATKTLNQIHSLIPKTTDPKLKESYRSCSEHYDNAIGDLNKAESDFKQGDYFGMNIQASGALDAAGDCDDETEGLPASPSLIKGNQDLKNFCGIILVVANRLKGSN
ncbi:hypothetical protein Ddye_018959 [Dipteronia dyeriana]|uniref:Pectinesterase inhibitor domain-containing protein n=1 Tax=Dipteronia dyeriana TaxID=168575 RepID=A0AAD9TWX3_9ROSI|nr:hypothetical protein Ddye_018959 [Dipteronia dyeriana]